MLMIIYILAQGGELLREPKYFIRIKIVTRVK